MKIIVHMNPDLDALTGVYLFVRLQNLNNDEWEVAFLPEIGDVYIDCLPAQNLQDLNCSIYDHHEKNSKFKSATEAVFENLKNKCDPKMISVYKKLVDLVNDIDSANIHAKKYSPLMITNYINYLNLKKDFSKKAYWNKLFELLDASVEMLTLMEEAKSIEMGSLVINGYKIIFYDVTNKNVNPAPYCFSELGADFIIFKNGFNIGITKNVLIKNLSIESIKDMIDEDGWYAHPVGFIVAHGTSKYPAKKASKYDIPHLINLLGQFLMQQNYNEKGSN